MPVMIFGIIQSIADHFFIGTAGSSHIEIIVIMFITGIGAGDQRRCPLSLLLQYSGCQMERADLPVLLRTDEQQSENMVEFH